MGTVIVRYVIIVAFVGANQEKKPRLAIAADNELSEASAACFAAQNLHVGDIEMDVRVWPFAVTGQVVQGD